MNTTEPTAREQAIIAYVFAATGRTIGAESVRRVDGGDWLAHHPVDRAILTALDEHDAEPVGEMPSLFEQ